MHENLILALLRWQGLILTLPGGLPGQKKRCGQLAFYINSTAISFGVASGKADEDDCKKWKPTSGSIKQVILLG